MPVSFANFGAFAMDFTFDDIACRLFMAIENFLATTAVRLESRDKIPKRQLATARTIRTRPPTRSSIV